MNNPDDPEVNAEAVALIERRRLELDMRETPDGLLVDQSYRVRGPVGKLSIYPVDEHREIGMRGVSRRKTKSPIGSAYRAQRRRTSRAAAASSSRNR